MARSPEELRSQLRGLFAFPVTPFTASNEPDIPRYREHLRYTINAQPAAVFVCGGTGEFFSLDQDEYRVLVKTAVEEVTASNASEFAALGDKHAQEVHP